MGNYNPNAPILLGQEWVPIQDVDLEYNQAINSFEQGWSFTLTSATQINMAKFYIHRNPDNFIRNQVMTVNIYPRGLEDDAGPIRSVVIPANNGGITGSAVSYFLTSSTAEALSNASQNPAIQFNIGSGNAGRASVFFAMNQHAQLLNGKRILGVDYLTARDVDNANPATDGLSHALTLRVGGESSVFPLNFGPLADTDTPNTTIDFLRFKLGNTNPWFNSTNTPTGFSAVTPDVMDWTYSQLQRFEQSFGVGRLRVDMESFSVASAGPTVFIAYGALEVFFAEERRLATGSKIYNGLRSFDTGSGFNVRPPYMYGANAVLLYDLNGNANPILPAGEYTITLSQGNVGDDNSAAANLGAQPLVNAELELYTIPTHEGVRVNIPFPMDPSAVNKELTKEITHILPQISLHLSGAGGPVTALHAYGRQSVAQVYGNITATQEILDSAAGASFSYPWVRYYARRWGDTTVPLRLDSPSASVSGSGMGVFLSPEEWDELPEIVDGWKQVTLRFPTAPTMGSGTTPTWRWSATGEAAGSRWEVLGASAPAISGSIGTLFNLVPSPGQLGTVTYGAPSAGTTVNEGWIPQYAPYVSATADDQTSDAVLIFSQDPPAVSGFVVSTVTQPVSGIGQDCGLNPCAIPTDIYYNQLTWTMPSAVAVLDDFTRTSASGWGNLTSGASWTIQGGVATDHIVTNPYGQHIIQAVATARRDVTGTYLDTEAQISASIPVLPTGAAIATGLLLRNVDSSNHYLAELIWNTNNTVAVRLSSRVAGTRTTLAETTIGWFTPGDFFTIRAKIDGNNLYAKAWKYDGEDPGFWQANAVSTTFTAAGNVGVSSEALTSNTNSYPLTVSYKHFTNEPVTSYVYEIQRSDTITDWETIMLGNPLVSGFNDYEARVGLVSSYRIREVNAYGFYGPWSSTVSATITDPGLVAGCVNDGHVLILTTNSRQSGSANLAYLSVWDANENVDEDFTFPEASWVQLQAMYGKDFYTAFRPLERGGDRFQRKVLVQAAAISPETLADFTGLRDLAWDTVPYVCVRDEDGNRWFATIVVPAANVRLNRSLYTAAIDIIEVTDTPTAVSP